MNQRLPWEQGDPNLLSAAERRRSEKAAVYVDASLRAHVHFSAHATVEHALVQSITEDARRSSEIVDIAHPALQAGPPRVCELLMCLALDPEFQEDRLGDFQERFDNIWVPKFGHRMAVLLYVWHVLRQARFMDWIIRLLSNGSP